MQGQSVPCAIATESIISLQITAEYRMISHGSDNENRLEGWE